MTQVTVCPASQVDQQELHAFLRRFFGDAKAEFLRLHGTWWHRGEKNRWVLRDGDSVAGYCAVIPTTCLVAGRPRDAVWWVDLVIAPEYRGRGLQTLFDDLVRGRGRLLLGFPNALAAEIHRHHGWGVREDLRSLLLPLDPRRVSAVRRASGIRGAALRLAAGALVPGAFLWRRHLAVYRPTSARRLREPDFETLAAAAEQMDSRWLTTLRDASYLRWRFGEGPFPHRIYVAGDGPRPQLVLITRRIGLGGTRVERWLDLFGDLDDRRLLDDLLRCAAGDAARGGVAQITALAAHPSIHSALRRQGFVAGSSARFCWLDDERETMRAITEAPHHWCLGDSDNDEPAV